MSSIGQRYLIHALTIQTIILMRELPLHTFSECVHVSSTLFLTLPQNHKIHIWMFCHAPCYFPSCVFFQFTLLLVTTMTLVSLISCLVVHTPMLKHSLFSIWLRVIACTWIVILRLDAPLQFGAWEVPRLRWSACICKSYNSGHFQPWLRCASALYVFSGLFHLENPLSMLYRSIQSPVVLLYHQCFGCQLQMSPPRSEQESIQMIPAHQG